MIRSLSLVVLFVASALGHAAEISQKPNIVVILADDFGWGSLGCYGAPDDLKTPNLDRLAREGRRFTNAYAPGSVCSPTRYGLMTGRYYWRTSEKSGTVLMGKAPLHIETDRMTLASLCKSQGYRTAAFGKWHLGFTKEKISDWSMALKPGPLQIGFDHFFGMAANLGNGPNAFINDEEVTEHIPGEPIVVKGGMPTGTTTGIRQSWQQDRVMETLVTHATKWIDESQHSPFFLYFAPNAVHEPIVPNGRFAGNRYGKYGDFIGELDWSVGQILSKLDELKLADNTLVIFSSDNGGVVNPGAENISAAMNAGLKINGPLRGGKHSEWEGGFREPFLVRWPGRVPADTVSDQVICLTDVLATLAGVLNVPLPKGAAEDSFNVLPAITESDTGLPIRDHVILQSAHGVYDIRMGNWKLVERASAVQVTPKKKNARAQKKKSEAEADELYNLADDPAEAKNVVAANTELAAKMKKLLEEARVRNYTRPGAGP